MSSRRHGAWQAGRALRGMAVGTVQAEAAAPREALVGVAVDVAAVVAAAAER